ncbi:MAG: ribonuclease HII [Pseudomonadota bacterium]
MVRSDSQAARTVARRGETAAARALTYAIEGDIIARHGAPLCGVDEAGRGPWAGPVVAAAVVLDPERVPTGITDSKALRAASRDHLFAELNATASIGIGIADVARIDRDNILQATLWAMQQAVAALAVPPRIALVDGDRAPKLPCPALTMVKGDALCLSIAAASIIAKVTRDRLMEALAQRYPHHGFERHKGYGTAQHSAALDAHGVTEAHRRSFRPVQLKLHMAGLAQPALVADDPAVESQPSDLPSRQPSGAKSRKRRAPA